MGALDHLYFEWLTYDIERREYNKLLVILFKTPFLSIVPNDQNRAIDGVDLRSDFRSANRALFIGSPEEEEWFNLECSILEMLIALSDRAAYESNIDSDVWFWTFLENLNLLRFTDYKLENKEGSDKEVSYILQRLNNRSYNRDGLGGIFPLIDPVKDQRRVEIWYQMSAYLMENFQN